MFLLVASAVASLLAGCSDDQSRERDYAKAVLDARESIDRAYDDARPTNRSAVQDEAARARMATLTKAAMEAHARVRALDPPEHLRDEDRRIVEAFARIEHGASMLSTTPAGRTGNTVQRTRDGLDALIAGRLELEEEIERLQREDGD